MSDHIIKIIPSDPYFRIADKQSQSAVQLIQQNVKADMVRFSSQEKPAFVDCGSNLESISCPLCNETLDFGWWSDAMDKAFQNDFMDLSVKLPCCDKDSTLNNLIYYFPCGFSTAEFDIINPTTEVDDKVIEKLQSMLEITVRIIHAHI